MSHLKYEALLNYLENRPSAEERGEAEAHLSLPCEQCERRLVLLRAVLRSAAADRTAAPPASVLKQAVEIPVTHAKPPQPGPWTRLIATLTFDSRLQVSAAMTRGAARERQMLFTAERVDIDLKIKSERGDHDLMGQVLGEQAAGDALSAFVCLQMNTGQLLKATETDSLGQFAFHGISSGVYDLIFDLENQEVAVMGVEVKND